MANLTTFPHQDPLTVQPPDIQSSGKNDEYEIKEEIEETNINIKDEPEEYIEETDLDFIKQEEGPLSQTGANSDSVDETKDCKSTKNLKQYTCNHCNYSSKWKSNLLKHVIYKHTPKEKIQWSKCQFCRYKGKTKENLRIHLRYTHNITFRWNQCPHCPFKTKVKAHFDKHVISNHTKPEDIHWIFCEFCPYKAKFGEIMKQHVLSKHSKPDPPKDVEWFTCNLCYYKYKTQRGLNSHIAKHSQPKVLKPKVKTREIPVFIENKLCFRRVVVDAQGSENSYDCDHCLFTTFDREELRKHVLKEHVVVELKKEDEQIVKKTFKTQDVVVMVDNVPCVKKVVVYQIS